VVLFLGTSLTAGQGLDPEQAYPALIQKKIDAAGLGYRVVNAGLGGDTSADALGRLDWLLRQKVDVLVVETGANDALRGQDPAATRENIQAILAEAGSSMDKIVSVTIVLADEDDFAGMNEEYLRWFPSDPPARQGAKLPVRIPGLKVSIAAIAAA